MDSGAHAAVAAAVRAAPNDALEATIASISADQVQRVNTLLADVPNTELVPSAALVGSTMEMQLALRHHAEEKGLGYIELKRKHEEIMFQLSRQPEVSTVKYPKRVQALQDSFGCNLKTPVLIPVIHVLSPEQAIRNAQLAFDSGADGVFLINHGHALPIGCGLEVVRGPDGFPAPCEAQLGEEGSVGHAQLEALAECYQAVRGAFGPKAWIGVNVIQLEAQHTFAWIAKHAPSANALWVDDLPVEPALIEWETVGFGRLAKKFAVRNLRWKTLEEQEAALHCLEQRQLSGWNGLVFGGVAYKYRPYRCHHNQDIEDSGVACQALLSHWGALASHFCDVLITSGGATGSPCPVTKLQAFGNSRPLAFSGGPKRGDTVSQYGKVADVVLAATAIGKGEPGSENNFLELDGDKVNTWLQAYRNASTGVL
mmetsp:Transcript_22241/g.39156  ORF Transcript_22241/g.39156 Transcript_22241/m.39156 type:complete len:427 (+) Transcript_22241:82-1362(+)